MRATIDSNVWISALKFGGEPLRLLQSNIEFVTSEAIIAEICRVLRDKFAWPEDKLAQAERTVRKLCAVAKPTQTLDVVPSDADDNRIIECAVAGGCDAIITGDQDLLRLKSYAGIGIMRVSEMLRARRTV